MSSKFSSKPFLSLKNATFRLGDRLVFPNTSWVFERGEQWAILGPNGSGKSLLADCLRGQLPLVQGALEYHFRVAGGLSPEDAIGHVGFEDRRRGLHGEVVQSRWNSIEEEGALLVLEHLSYERVMDVNPFEIRDNDKTERKAFAKRSRRAATLLELGPLEERTLLSLSNGERQRVELARVLCRSLRLLILDEPFFGLDRATREHFRVVLEHLMSSPLKILFITTRADDLPRHVTNVLQVRDCKVVRSESRTTSSPPRTAPHSRFSQSQQTVRLTAGTANVASTSHKERRHAPLVELRTVTVRYGQNLIVDRLNWTIHAGESWALLGPNGSGKSTILSLIQGDNPQAYRNEVTVFGHRRGSGESIWDIKQRIGWVSPELQAHFPQEVSCFEAVASGFFESNGLFETPTPRQRQKTRYWLERFGLWECAQTPLFGISAGAQRLVLLARALVKSPELLLLDEPCQGLDPACTRLFVHTLDRLIRETPVTVVYVTHREEEIPGSIRRVLRLRRRRAG